MSDLEWWMSTGRDHYDMRWNGESWFLMRRSPSSVDAYSFIGEYETADEAVCVARSR